MTYDHSQMHFFLGANTPQGFVSRFGQIIDPVRCKRCYIIKGGPGSGKSTLMKGFADEAEKLGMRPIYFHCSSDVASLDAVSADGDRYVILDGTPPHAVEPGCPGAFETLVPLGDCWNEEALQKDRSAILELMNRNRLMHAQCRMYLSAAGSLLGEVSGMARDYVFPEKVARFA